MREAHRSFDPEGMMAEELNHEHHEHEESAAGSIDVASLPDVKLSPKAIEMVRKMQAKEGLGDGHGLRIGVVGGGCSGFQYQLKFDTVNDGDRIVTYDGVCVLVDEFSLPYIAGTTLDYVEGLHGAGFRFDNPRASRTCGCGSSFSA
jgi:iron-sulfur cluster insertion protein